MSTTTIVYKVLDELHDINCAVCRIQEQLDNIKQCVSKNTNDIDIPNEEHNQMKEKSALSKKGLKDAKYIQEETIFILYGVGDTDNEFLQ